MKYKYDWVGRFGTISMFLMYLWRSKEWMAVTAILMALLVLANERGRNS